MFIFKVYYLAAQVDARKRFFPHIFLIIDILPEKYITYVLRNLNCKII